MGSRYVMAAVGRERGATPKLDAHRDASTLLCK